MDSSSPPERARLSAGAVLLAVWKRLRRRPRFVPDEPASWARLGQEWRSAKGEIEHVEATTRAPEMPPRRLEELERLYTAVQTETTRLRCAPPSAGPPAGSRDIDAMMERARERLRQAEGLIDEIAEWSALAEANAEEWERLAMLAVQAGDDDLALEALERWRELVNEHAALKREVGVGRAVLEEMRAALEAMGRPS